MLAFSVMSDGEVRPKKRTVNGVTRSLLLTKPQDERLNRLVGAFPGLNRNQLVRLVAEKARPEDIQMLIDR